MACEFTSDRHIKKGPKHVFGPTSSSHIDFQTDFETNLTKLKCAFVNDVIFMVID